MALDPATLSGWAAAVFTGLMAAYERSRSNKSAQAITAVEKDKAVNEAVISANEELVKLARSSADGWKERFDAKCVELAAYREEQHTKQKGDQELVLRYTLENSELRAKTDVTPILEGQRQQNLINSKIVETLDVILGHLRVKTEAPKP